MTVERVRNLRRNQTRPEALLWSALRRGQIDGRRFRRQHPCGPYIVDFVCLKEKCAIEIDGPSHDQTAAQDARRTAYLEGKGFRVVRFSNEDVLTNLEGVVETIRAILRERGGD